MASCDRGETKCSPKKSLISHVEGRRGLMEYTLVLRYKSVHLGKEKAVKEGSEATKE